MSAFSALDSLSLSTCWCSDRHTDGYEMVEQMVGLGFKKIELSHGIRLSLVPGILRAVEEGIVEIPSIHNFCPLPSSVQHAAPNFYQPASSNSSERDLWLHYSNQTLNFAQKVGAEHIVMHSGNVISSSLPQNQNLKSGSIIPVFRSRSLVKVKIFLSSASVR